MSTTVQSAPTCRSEKVEQDDSDTLHAIADSARELTARLQKTGHDTSAVWRELAAAGWFSMLVPETNGGLGLTLAHVVALHRELGRNPIATPVLASGLLPSVVLSHLPSSELRDSLLEKAQRGELVIGFAWQDDTGQISPDMASAVTLTRHATGPMLDGTKRWVMSASYVDGWLIDAVDGKGSRSLHWVPVETPGVTVDGLENVDQQFACNLVLAHVSATSELASGNTVTKAICTGIDTARIAQAAELVGVSQAAFDLTLEYLKTRIQFDKPIGANQALQHRMVDAYVRLQMVEAGLAAAVERHLRGDLPLAQIASWTKARAAELALEMTRMAVQLHGAIGVTDEYALGRYWKRALSLATWLGNADRHTARHLEHHEAHEESVDAGGQEASRGSEEADDWQDVRSTVRQFLHENYPAELRHPHRRLHLHEVKEWYLALSRKGWLAPGWPRDHGGMGLSPQELIAFIDEFEDFGAARLPDQGIINVGPILIRYGTEEQRHRYLPKILSGEHIWCQGYSEPNAGSDLASLKTRAESVGDHFCVNGQKIWSTLAQDATHMFMLVRTSMEKRKQDGISFLLVDLATPGVTVRPIRNIAGEEEFCEVFFDNVRVPRENLVGALGQGWKIGMALLGFERLFVGSPKTCQHALAQLANIGRARKLWQDAAFRATYGKLLLDVLELKASFANFAEMAGRGEDLPANVSILKIWATETYTRISAQLVRFVDEHGAINGKVRLSADAHVTPLASLLNASMTTIYAGSNEIQKNILAKRVLGLPS